MTEMIVQKCIQELKQFFEIMQVTDSDLSKKNSNNCNKKIIYLRSRKIANNAYTLKHLLNTF